MGTKSLTFAGRSANLSRRLDSPPHLPASFVSETEISRARAVRDGIEQAKALREAEEYLALVAGSWYALDYDDRAVAVKHALGWLTVLALGSPTRAAIWYDELAAAARVSKADLKREVENRADFWRNFNTFAATRREETLGALCQILY
jgi:hypothetical protein